MNVYISADIEGVCGVVDRAHWDMEGADFGLARRWMAEEVNAAVEGALQAGAKRIVVKDSHHKAINIERDRLHAAAELISGWGPLASMVEGIDASFDALFLIGYHARARSRGGVLAHTWTRNMLELRVNDVLIGEAGWAAAFAGQFDVPVVLATGDSKFVEEMAEELPAGVRTVVTKYPLSRFSARMRSPEAVREDIRRQAASALADAKSIQPLKPELPATITMTMREWEVLDACEAIPGVERLDVQTFRFVAKDFFEAQKFFMTMVRVSRDT